MSFKFTKENQDKFNELLTRYPEKRAAMLPALWLIQQQQGWISPESMEHLAEALDVTPGHVYETVTFYTMYNLKPIGKNHIQVCDSICCCLRGANATVDYFKKKLGVDLGHSTEDGKFHLSAVECLGSCGTAPMCQINDDYYENLTEEGIDKLLEELK